MSAYASTDQNLLFGILALQMDFIGRDALVAAMNGWVLDKAKPLGRVLLEQQALSGEEHDLLEALVQKHIQKHGDAQKSLAAVSSVGSVRRKLEQIADDDLHASLVHVSAARLDSDLDPFATRPPSVGVPTSSGLRFHILRPHAKGGLGEVFVAHDEELHREVALKEIQNRHADDPDSRARFLLEAEITGGLEHPGIVPVYGLGQYSDGRPYYAMRFIPGDSLKEAIARFHKAEELSRDPSERALALRQLLGRFVDVCNAIAYAHSRGVLHRDLKPGNVMLGPYGETLVVDWGLAKAQGSQTKAENSTVLERPFQPQLSGDIAPTQMGSAIGTPAFMPPEQAAGRLDLLGPASDIYSLGATLYCLLTGKAPVVADDVGEVLRRVRAGDFPPPRQVKRDVPAALEAVCLKAMALRSEDRYGTPRELAADVERWLADEPVSAWPESVAMEARRWLTGITAEVAESPEAIALYEAALVVVEKLARTVPEVRHQVNLGQGHHNLGLLYRNVGKPEEAEAAYRKALIVRGELVRASPRVAEYRSALANSHYNLGNLYRALGRPADAAFAYREALAIRAQLVQDQPNVAPYQASLAASYYSLGALYSTSGETNQAETAYHNALDVQERLERQYPRDFEYRHALGKTYHNLALVTRAGGRLDRAEYFNRKAVATFHQLVQARPTATEFLLGLGMSLGNLGQLMSLNDKLVTALDWYAQAVQKLEQVLDQDKDNGTARQCWRSVQKDRTTVLTRLGQHADALRILDEAIGRENGTTRDNLRLRRATTLARLGDHFQAAAEAEALTQGVCRVRALYDAARIFSLASAAAGRDTSLTLADRERLAAEYAVRGVRLLTSILAAGHLQSRAALNTLREEEDLHSLRMHPDFHRLLDTLGPQENSTESSEMVAALRGDN